MKFSRGNFGRRGHKKSELDCSPKKNYNHLRDSNASVSLGKVIETVSSVGDESQSMVFAAVPRLECSKEVSDGMEDEVYTFADYLEISSSPEEFFLNMEYFPAHVETIEVQTRGQSDNPLWMSMREHAITASKAHDVNTKMEVPLKKKVQTADFSALSAKISGKARVLKRGTFLCKDLPFVGGSSDSIVSCDCCGKFCLAVKCPFILRDMSPMNPEVKL